jgi:hypothetical protein
LIHVNNNSSCVFLKDNIHLWMTLFYALERPTVCVTRAGAGGGTPSDWEKAEA